MNDTGGEFSELVADTGTAATTYTDNTVAASTHYTYRIKAINEHGVSERSRWFHIETLEVPVPAKPTGLNATATHDQVAFPHRQADPHPTANMPSGSVRPAGRGPSNQPEHP